MEISNLNDIITDPMYYLENFCIAFNQYAPIFFIILKYIFVIVLIICGILTLLKARDIYFKSRALPKEKVESKIDPLTKPRLLVGTVYIVIASGILFNYLTYFLIWILDPIPDRLIFSLFSLDDIDPYTFNRITDINLAIYPHGKTLYYLIAMASFENVVHLTLSIWYLFMKVDKPRKTLYHLFKAVPGSILCGFTTFMPFII